MCTSSLKQAGSFFSFHPPPSSLPMFNQPVWLPCQPQHKIWEYSRYFRAVTYLLYVNKFSGTIVTDSHYTDNPCRRKGCYRPGPKARPPIRSLVFTPGWKSVAAWLQSREGTSIVAKFTSGSEQMSWSQEEMQAVLFSPVPAQCRCNPLEMSLLE